MIFQNLFIEEGTLRSENNCILGFIQIICLFYEKKLTATSGTVLYLECALTTCAVEFSEPFHLPLKKEL